MEAVNLKKFKKKFDLNRKSLRYFITRTENRITKDLDPVLERVNKEVWETVDCISCANCCKVMSPTYTPRDIKRIAAHLGMRPIEVKEKWLYVDKSSGDWMNRSQPCQFLDLSTNMCSIYEARPADCAGFPHLLKKPVADYFYIHKQNIEYCPATMMLIEKLKSALYQKESLSVSIDNGINNQASPIQPPNFFKSENERSSNSNFDDSGK